MADINTVVVVSDRQELINQISRKLVLLRNLDKIKSCSIEEAQNMFDGFSPNAMILHCDNNNIHAINLVKYLKKQDAYKTIIRNSDKTFHLIRLIAQDFNIINTFSSK